MWEPRRNTTKLIALGSLITITLGIHYGWLIDPIFGHVHWMHAIHGRFCYIPIVVAAAWFGLRGGLWTALIISVLVLPYVFGASAQAGALADELVEITFYFAIGALAGALFDRELWARKKAEDMRLQLERSHKLSLVGQIAAGMAHEIKNPLASIKGSVEILSDGSTGSAEREEFRNIVLKEIKRINGSVTDFLEFAKPGETRFEHMDFSAVLQSSIKQLKTQATKKGIILTDRIGDNIRIKGDEEKIHQVLLNLLLNAVDASDNNTEIGIILDKDDAAGEAVLCIEDSGEGIKDSDLDKVFDPFFTTRSSGTGLGLAIAKSIVERHHGKIALKNRSKGGAVAEVRLPLDAGVGAA